jgi:hypothetical protein
MHAAALQAVATARTHAAADTPDCDMQSIAFPAEKAAPNNHEHQHPTLLGVKTCDLFYSAPAFKQLLSAT